ncbi:MAG: hypothetical protein KF760_09330 [Candidatus Eremiobacteraeota bacterium]|nr:hypothetical protein [Candidatus Eremiobacteraeota bacterium]MCW5866023.1 hypothetical protein [Candidatus Eremiobacteraeota bacterium]
MLKIERVIFDKLGFDFDEALKQFSAEKEQHRYTVDVPAPSANEFVEAAYYAGGYEIVEPEPEPEPEEVEAPVFVPDPRKPEVIERLQQLKGQKAEFQAEEIRKILLLILEILPF